MRMIYSAKNFEAMIFLRDNVMIKGDLALEDVKPRLLGMQHPNHFLCA